MECPIGLICELMECRRQVCLDYAQPIPLPYEICDYDWRYPKGTFVSYLPHYEEEETFLDYEIGRVDHYNAWLRRVRESMIEAGWGGSSPLPYSWNADLGCLEVDLPLLLENEDYEFDSGKLIKELPWTWHEDRGFALAVPLDGRPIKNYAYDIQEDGFCRSWLRWSRHFNDDEE